MSAATSGTSREIPDIAALIRATASNKLLLPKPKLRIYSSRREHHMTNIFTFFSTRTLLQIIFALGSTVAMKAWSLGLLFGG